MNRLNFNHLFYFYIVAKEGSIKDAAAKLHVSQPTISDQIKLLEEYFDSKLFYRKNRSLSLTPEGELACEYAERLFSLGEELTRKLKHKEHLPKKCLDIGITPHMSQYFLYETILPLFKQNDLAINIKEDKRHYLLADLEKGEIDMMFSDSKDGLSNTLSPYRIGVNRTYIVGHKKFNQLKKRYPASISDAPFFHYTKDSFLRYEVDLFFHKNNVSPKVIGEADDVELLQMLTEKGIALTVVPEVIKNRFSANPNIIVLGELTELQTHLYGIIRSDYRGFGHKLLTNKLK